MSKFIIFFVFPFLLLNLNTFALDWRIIGKGRVVLREGQYDLGDRDSISVRDASIKIFNQESIYYYLSEDGLFFYILNLDVGFCYQVKEKKKEGEGGDEASDEYILRSDFKGTEPPDQFFLKNSDRLEWVHYLEFEPNID